jgi:hypothetical protein
MANSLRALTLAASAGLMVATASYALGDYQDEVGFTKLKNEMGAATPDGSGVSVGQVEAIANDYNYAPNGSLPELTLPGRVYSLDSGGTYSSGHADEVARHFYGVDSIAPKIPRVHIYSASSRAIFGTSVNVIGWTDGAYLKYGNYLDLPEAPVDRPKVMNHSWIWTTDAFWNTDILHRLDYVVQTQDQINVVGLNNAGTGFGPAPLLGASFNAIAVGRTDGQHDAPGGIGAFDAKYSASRVRPSVVAPLNATSFATPVVSATAALLVDTASRINNPNGAHATVVKAAIMAGADRQANFGTPYVASSANHLSTTYGAGEVDVYNSYHIIAGGETDAGGNLSRSGFDYNPAFQSNAAASYFFGTSDDSVGMTASLVWNVNINPVFNSALFGESTLYNLDLQLIDLTDQGAIVQSSAGLDDNTENLWLDALAPGHNYELRVLAADGQTPFTWDYGLAWQFTGDVLPVPEPTALMLLAPLLLAVRRRARGR